MSSQLTGSGSEETTAGEYGANEWLVDEMYEKYLADPDSVDRTWWPVLEHYRPVRTGETAAELNHLRVFITFALPSSGVE